MVIPSSDETPGDGDHKIKFHAQCSMCGWKSIIELPTALGLGSREWEARWKSAGYVSFTAIQRHAFEVHGIVIPMP